MGPTQDNFLSWQQLRKLITGQPEKMHRDLRNIKGSTDSCLLWQCGFWSVVIINTFRILCFHSVCQRAWTRYKIQQGHCFMLPLAHTSGWGNHNLNAYHTTASCSFQAVYTFAYPVLYHPWLCSIILKPTLHYFFQSGHLNRHMYHHSLAQAEPLLYGEI